ncbi:MAG: hypothetical protein FGM22_08385 [Burkholderiaceae bacterium]|nr:hypothetical protein [Burkholderiaceae bacterium]
MNAKIPRFLAYDLAVECGRRIHANLVSLHLAAIDHSSQSDLDRAQMGEVRELISSIADRYDRADFIRQVKRSFHSLRAARGTHPTSRSYVAAVMAHRQAIAA